MYSTENVLIFGNYLIHELLSVLKKIPRKMSNRLSARDELVKNIGFCPKGNASESC